MKLDSGKFVTIAILGMAVAAASFAWWHQFQQGRRSLEFWSAEGAYLIRRAPKVELMKLSDTDTSLPDGERNLAAELPEAVGEGVDVSLAPGLVHARQALISDSSYVWDAPPGAPVWEYSLRFSEGDRKMEIVLDLTRGYAGSRRRATPLQLGPTLANGLRQFLEEQLSTLPREPISGNAP